MTFGLPPVMNPTLSVARCTPLERAECWVGDLVKGDQKKPTYLAITPNGKVPTSVNGKRVTCEADAVICQLSDDSAFASAARLGYPRPGPRLTLIVGIVAAAGVTALGLYLEFEWIDVLQNG